MTQHGDVWVFAEQTDGKINSVVFELLSKARELAAPLGSRTAAVLLGRKVQPLVQELYSYGADVVYLAEHDELADFRTLPYSRILCELAREHQPEIILYGATVIGRDLAPRVASDLLTGLTADCTDLQIGDFYAPRTKKDYKNILYQIRPAFGGNIMATIVSPDHRPQMATVREGVMKIGEPNGDKEGVLTLHEVKLAPEDLVLQVVDRAMEESPVDLRAARIVVTGGAGVGGRDGFELIRELADTLGGEVGASRAAVDAGYCAKAHQVGQTGTTVRPALYIAAGVSGAIQHRAGMQESGRILAINNDPDAPIFDVAHYAIVGDLFQVIPMMIKAYKKKA